MNLMVLILLYFSLLDMTKCDLRKLVSYWEDELPTLSGWIIKELMGFKSLLDETELYN